MSAPAPPCRLLIIGDSLADEWQAPPPPGWAVARHGWPGQRATEIAPRLPGLIARHRPQALLIMAGSNDARAAALWPAGDAIPAAATAIAAMAQTGTASGTKVIVARLAPLGPQPWWRQWLIGTRQSAAMAAIEARLQLPPGTARLASPNDKALRRDHLHYNAAGYARLAADLARLLPPCPVQAAIAAS
ncbi:SGNH/GDSL hydrolase family protein [Sandarakinorhabdus cyanobacteriorum]|uniref:SGNH/GDSL hydrolase family protein n=1 Tax=Sandarakinorhabdus cyanobacteriorum TaxID=1981098 RepID=UPI0013FD4F1C|nr:SGNH/GDSL hydrolase family protein [Sandarakinorhabdus cyanobacteriorum]